MKKNQDKTLSEKIFEHRNDYGFNPMTLSRKSTNTPFQNLSIVIPYFETGHLILQTLRHLYNAIAYVQEQNIHWKYEIIIVDDGSAKSPAKKLISKSQFPNLKILLIKKNKGRSVSRNLGLKRSQYELCLFMDSDILIDQYLLTNHLKIQSYVKLKHGKHAVTVTFFEDISQEDERIYLSILKPNDLILNDFRLKCIYGATWYGCEEDKKFIGRKFEIARDTNYFRDWQGRYGPWVLPNMILGGFFMVGTESAKKVYGFDESFEGYGFTETPLSTKLIAICEQFVIPVMLGGALHVGGKDVDLSRGEKDKLFRQKHDYYFNTYLQNTIEKISN